VGAALTHVRGGTIPEAGANGGEDVGGGQTPAHNGPVDGDGWGNDHTALGLQLNLLIELDVGNVSINASAVGHALRNKSAVHSGALVNVIDAILIGENVGRITPLLELGNILPPLDPNPVGRAVDVPNAQAPKALADHIGT